MAHKKDTDKGQPWCKILKHWELDSDLVVVSFEDSDVKLNDFYYIAIMQKGQYIIKNDKYMAFLGPIFIDNVD
jgi:hypothetical protein